MEDSHELSFVHNADLSATGFGHTLDLIGGKYKMLVLYALSLSDGPVRYNELKRLIGNVSFKTLTNTLKELVSDELVIRKEYPQIPPKVEYSLTDCGHSLMPVIDLMCEWGETH